MRVSSDISNPADPGIGSQKTAKLVDAAQQFEAMMLQELLKPIQGAAGEWGGDQESDGDSGSDTMTSFGTEAFARAIAKGGGFGIARAVVSEVSSERRGISSEKSIR